MIKRFASLPISPAKRKQNKLFTRDPTTKETRTFRSSCLLPAAFFSLVGVFLGCHVWKPVVCEPCVVMLFLLPISQLSAQWRRHGVASYSFRCFLESSFFRFHRLSLPFPPQRFFVRSFAFSFAFHSPSHRARNLIARNFPPLIRFPPHFCKENWEK